MHGASAVRPYEPKSPKVTTVSHALKSDDRFEDGEHGHVCAEARARFASQMQAPVSFFSSSSSSSSKAYRCKPVVSGSSAGLSQAARRGNASRLKKSSAGSPRGGGGGGGGGGMSICLPLFLGTLEGFVLALYLTCYTRQCLPPSLDLTRSPSKYHFWLSNSWQVYLAESPF